MKKKKKTLALALLNNDNLFLVKGVYYIRIHVYISDVELAVQKKSNLYIQTECDIKYESSHNV